MNSNIFSDFIQKQKFIKLSEFLVVIIKKTKTKLNKSINLTIRKKEKKTLRYKLNSINLLSYKIKVKCKLSFVCLYLFIYFKN